jgi:hypothetical protein
MRKFARTTRRQCLVLIAAALACMGPAMAEEVAPLYIGVATMLPDGTIRLRLRAPLPGGGSGEGEMDYKPGDPDYQQVLAHLGGLKPGETKPVKPWPDNPLEKR